MADKKLNIKVRTKGAKKSKKDLKGVEGGMKSLGKAAAIAGSAFFAAKGLITGFKKLIELAGAQELAEKKLEASLGRVSQALLKQASALQQVSMFGDEAIIEAQALIAAFVDDEEAIKKATQATLDLAAAKGMDLTAAADLVSKTLGSSTNAMSRYGIEVNGAVGSTERLDSLVGNIADKFGGQAKAQTETMAGAIKQLDMAMGDLGEDIGEVFIKPVTTAATVLKEFARQAQGVDWDLTFGSLKIQLMAVSPQFAALAGGLDVAAKKIEEAKKAGEGPQESPFPTDEEMEKLKSSFYITGKVWDIRREESGLLREVYVPKLIEASEAEKKAAEFASQTAISLGTSALMGDNVTESLKRAVIQLMIMVAQAKLYDYFMTSASGGTNKVSSAIVNFLFGKSPTQTSPSPNGGGSNITINQNFGGMGVIDHNFAANSIIPAINKAISTGQARIG
jgi:hypothetical protein